MNIKELREQWHRDADHGTDWHEAAWDLMRELDEARNELASRPKSLADYWAGRAKKAESDLATNKSLKAERDIFLEDARRAYAERDEAKRLSDSLSRECVVLADQRNAARGDLGAAEASLKFALETNKRLKAERDEARSQFLQATQSGKWAYAVELEEKIERMYKDAAAVMDIAGRSGSRVIDLEARLEALQGELEIAMGTGDWVHVNQAFKIVKGEA